MTPLGSDRRGVVHCIVSSRAQRPSPGLVYATTFCSNDILLVVGDAREHGRRELITCPSCAAHHVKLCFDSWLD